MDLIKKGDNIGISLRKIGVGLGWKYGRKNGHVFDLDLSAFILDGSGKFVTHPDDNTPSYNQIRRFFVFFNNEASPDGAVRSSGDDMGGGEDGGEENDDDDKETIDVDLDKLDSRAVEIVFTATLEDYENRGHSFGDVQNSFIRVFNQENGEEICRYDLEDDFSSESAIEFGRLIKKSGDWEFEATGIGHDGGLLTLVNKYKVEDWG
jgi:tellurium resistance protein TerD